MVNLYNHDETCDGLKDEPFDDAGQEVTCPKIVGCSTVADNNCDGPAAIPGGEEAAADVRGNLEEKVYPKQEDCDSEG